MIVALQRSDTEEKIMRVPRLTGLLCLLVAIGVAVATAGCGSGDSGSGATASSGNAAGSSSCVTEAKKLVANYRKPLPFKAPPGSVDMLAMKGKTLWIISITNTPFVRQGTAGFMAAAKTVGATGKFFDAKGNITLANQGIATAVEQKAGGIVLWNVEPKNVAGQLEKAKAAGVPVIDVHVGDPDAPLAPGVSSPSSQLCENPGPPVPISKSQPGLRALSLTHWGVSNAEKRPTDGPASDAWWRCSQTHDPDSSFMKSSKTASWTGSASAQSGRSFAGDVSVTCQSCLGLGNFDGPRVRPSSASSVRQVHSR
jgi:hypothetical protein